MLKPLDAADRHREHEQQRADKKECAAAEQVRREIG